MPLYIDGVLSGRRTLETKDVKLPAASTDPEEYFGPFIGSKTRPLFHRPNCEWMRDYNLDARYSVGLLSPLKV